MRDSDNVPSWMDMTRNYPFRELMGMTFNHSESIYWRLIKAFQKDLSKGIKEMEEKNKINWRKRIEGQK